MSNWRHYDVVSCTSVRSFRSVTTGSLLGKNSYSRQRRLRTTSHKIAQLRLLRLLQFSTIVALDKWHNAMRITHFLPLSMYSTKRLRKWLSLFMLYLYAVYTFTGWPKMAPFLLALTLQNIKRFSKLFHYRYQEKIRNNTITKDPTTPQVCRYTALWNVKRLKSNNWKQDDFYNNIF